MKEKYILTTELKRIFTHIKQELIKEYPTNKIVIEYFLMSILYDESSIAYQIIEKVTLSEVIEILQQTIVKFLTSKTDQIQLKKQPLFDEVYDEYIKNISKKNKQIDSGLFLIEILKNNKEINKTFRGIGISQEQLEKTYAEQFSETELTKIEVKDKEKKEKKKDLISMRLTKPLNNGVTHHTNDVERYLVNLSKSSELEQIETVIGRSDVYQQIFRILTKQKKNNIVIVGDNGVGKTCIVEHLANLIRNGDVPLQLKNKTLMKLNFSDLLMGSGIRGMLETKIKSIISDAKKEGNYIIFIDDIQTLLDDQNKLMESDFATLLDGFLSEPNIMFICTTNHKSYNKNIAKHFLLKRRLCKISIDELSNDIIYDIIANKIKTIENFHNVIFSENCIETSINFSKKV